MVKRNVRSERKASRPSQPLVSPTPAVVDAAAARPSATALQTAAVFITFVLIFGSLTITSFRQQSPIFDEPVHLLAGYSYIKWNDFRINPEHPPFAKLW